MFEATSIGTVSVTSKLHVPPPTRLPPVSDSACRSVPRLMIDIEDEPPQKPSAGSVAATGNGRNVVSSSMKARSLRAKSALALSMVNRRTTSSPGTIGSSMNSLVRTGAATTKRSSMAGSPVTGLPPTSAVMAVVVLEKVPETPVGTCSVTLNVQEVSGLRLPPLKVSTLVPLSVPPQTLCVPLVLTSPGNTLSRLSL